MEIDMTAAIARIFPRASVARVAAIDAFVTLALFSGFGLFHHRFRFGRLGPDGIPGRSRRWHARQFRGGGGSDID